jgi:hypothetical protein
MGAMGVVIALCRGYKHSELKLQGYASNKPECERAGVQFKELREGRGWEPL